MSGKGADLRLVHPLSKREANAMNDRVLNYIEIGDIIKTGLIVSYRTAPLGDLPTRARMLVQEDDILVPTQ